MNERTDEERLLFYFAHCTDHEKAYVLESLRLIYAKNCGTDADQQSPGAARTPSTNSKKGGAIHVA